MKRRPERESHSVSGKVVLDGIFGLGQTVVVKGPPLEALRFQQARVGSLLTVTDLEGNDYRARVLRLGAEEASLLVFSLFPNPTESRLEVFLLQALPDKERMELIIQKTAELGVSGIVPFKSERSVSLEERESRQKKAHRWQEVAVRAVRQCRRARLPRVESYRSFTEALTFCGDGLRILLSEKRGADLKMVLKSSSAEKIWVMVGPEGGFTEREVALADESGFVAVKLGERILRTETAAIVLVGILQYELGDLSTGSNRL